MRRSLHRHLVVLLVAAALAPSCSPESESPPEQPPDGLAARFPPTGVKVLLVGIDGASFAIIRPLAAAGELPLFASLMERGAHGVLRSQPPLKSPALWTTIATGRPREVHGIADFYLAADDGEEAEPSLVSSSDRRVPALWNLLGPFARRVGFAGWWATWPAEEVSGWMVSDRMTRSRWSEWTEAERESALTHPPELAEELRPLVVDPERPPLEEILELVALTPDEVAEMEAARAPIFAHGPSVFKFAWATQRSYERMAERLLSADQPDLTGLFLIATDPVSHTFWHFWEPQRFRGVDPDEAERLGRLIPNLYRHNDRFLAHLLESMDPATVTIVVSDHGFKASGRRPKPKDAAEFAAWLDEERRSAAELGTVTVGQSGTHTLDGIFIASGGPIRSGVRVEATLVDVAPTVLALLGLPVSAEMEGRVLEEIIEPGFLERHPVRRIPSYNGLGWSSASPQGDQADDEEMREMLRSLGYID